MERICPTASEEMSFENVDDGRTDDGYAVYTISSPLSRELKTKHKYHNVPVLQT